MSAAPAGVAADRTGTTEPSLAAIVARLFERLAVRALVLFAIVVVLGFALLSEVLARNALGRSADVIESLLGMYADPTGEPTTVAPDMLSSALLGLGEGARFVILRTVESADGLPKVYYLSPGMPAKRIEDAGSSASPHALRQRIVGAVADRGWRNILYHRRAGSFDLYLSASRLPTLLALAGLALLILVTLPVAVFIARGAARRAVGHALQPLQALSHETRTIAPTALSRRVTSPTGVAELTNVAEAINAMLVRIEASHQALTQFTADVSHELRTPLTHLRAQVQWALDERRSREQQVEALGLIGDSVDQTARLIEGLLTLARGDSRELTPRLRDFDLSAMTEEVAEIGTVMSGDKPVSVRAASGAASGAGVTVYGDPEYTRQILLNFVSNAVRHTQEGLVEVALACDNGAVRVEVRDTGEGIGPEHVPRVFDRFYRVEASRSRDHGGAGLGLAIARALAVAQRARVSVRSAPGMGSTFTLDLPATRTEWASRERGALPPGA